MRDRAVLKGLALHLLQVVAVCLAAAINSGGVFTRTSHKDSGEPLWAAVCSAAARAGDDVDEEDRRTLGDSDYWTVSRRRTPRSAQPLKGCETSSCL